MLVRFTYGRGGTIVKMMKLFLSLLFCGFVVNGIFAKVDNGEYFIEAVKSEGKSLNPQRISDEFSVHVIDNLYEGLVEYDQKNDIVCGVAERYTISSDGKKYTFYLRPKARWSNGDYLTAQDFVFTIEHGLDPQTGFNEAILMKCINKVYAVDKHTLCIELKYQDVAFLQKLACSNFSPIHKKSVELYGDKYGSSPETTVSNGAYRAVKWIHNDYLKCELNPYYWNKNKVNMKHITFKVIANPITNVQSFEAGEVDMTSTIPQQYHNDNLHRYQSATCINLFFNFKKPQFQDINVRKALTLCLNNDKFVKEALRKFSISHLPISARICNECFKDIDKTIPELDLLREPMSIRIENAKKMLENAGYSASNPLKFTYTYPHMEERDILTAHFIYDSFKTALGDLIDIKLEGCELSVFLERVDRRDYDMSPICWVHSSNDPFEITGMFNSTSPYNYANYHNKVYDDTFDAHDTNRNQYLDRHKKLVRILLSDYVVIPICVQDNCILLNPSVKGLNLKDNILNVLRFKYLSKDVR